MYWRNLKLEWISVVDCELLLAWTYLWALYFSLAIYFLDILMLLFLFAKGDVCLLCFFVLLALFRVLVSLLFWTVWLDILFWWVGFMEFHLVSFNLRYTVFFTYMSYSRKSSLFPAYWWKWCYACSYMHWSTARWFLEQ